VACGGGEYANHAEVVYVPGTLAVTVPDEVGLDEAAFATVGVSGNDITLSDMGVTVRYVVDRLCVAAGPAYPDACTLSGDQLPDGSSESELLRAEDSGSGVPPIASPVSLQVVYRVSIRVTGPRRTQSFFQTTFTI